MLNRMATDATRGLDRDTHRLLDNVLRLAPEPHHDALLEILFNGESPKGELLGLITSSPVLDTAIRRFHATRTQDGEADNIRDDVDGPTQSFIAMRCGELRAKSQAEGTLSDEERDEWHRLQALCDHHKDPRRFAKNGEDCENCYQHLG